MEIVKAIFALCIPVLFIWYMFQPLPEERDLPKEEWAGRRIFTEYWNNLKPKS